jgi:hypothetical protein
MAKTAIVALPTGVRPTRTGAFPAKVAFPFLPTWVEEPHFFPGFGIDSSQIGTSVIIVGQARKRQVRFNRQAAVLLGNGMVKLKTARGEALRKATIFATVVGALADEIEKCFLIHTNQEALLGFFLRA